MLDFETLAAICLIGLFASLGLEKIVVRADGYRSSRLSRIFDRSSMAFMGIGLLVFLGDLLLSV